MKTLSQLASGLPQMRAAFVGWTQKLSFVVITQVVSETGFVNNVETPVDMDGTVQPLTAEQIMLKPEGQRSWEWLEIHQTLPGTKLKTDDRIVYNEVRYKVMARKNYSLYGYMNYHIIEDFQDE